MKRKRSFLSAALKRTYDRNPRPVLFITKNFRPFYFNEKMFVIAEELCSQTTIFNYLTDEGIRLFRNYNGREPIALPGKNGNVFIAEGVFEMGRTVCYKITFGGFDGFTPMSAESMKKFKLSQAVSDNFTHTLKTAADKLSSITTGDIPLRIHGEISDISKTVSGLSQISSSLSEIVGRVSGISGSGKSYFRLSELIAYLDKAVSPLVLPKNFNDKDDSSVIFASKGGVAETLLRTCRFITATADCNVKIKFEITHRSEMTVLHFYANVGRHTEPQPFGLSVGDGGIFNYGLRDARAFIESQGGNLLVTKGKSRLSVFISFPTVDAGTLPAGIFDSTKSNGFEHLLSEIDEYTESVVFLKTRRRRRLAELTDS